MLDIRLLQMIICCFDTLIVEFDIWPDTVKPRYFESLRKFEQISDVRDILHSCQNIVDRNVIIGENGTKIFFF